MIIKELEWNENELKKLKLLHKELSMKHDLLHIDGVYLTYNQLLNHPDNVSPPYALANKFTYSGAFAANPITWNYLKNKALVVKGRQVIRVGITDREIKTWGLLGIIRLHATIYSNEIISKTAVAEYAKSRFAPEYHLIVEEALNYRINKKNQSKLNPFKRKKLAIDFMNEVAKQCLQ